MTGLSDADRQHLDALMTSSWDCVTVSEFDIYAVALTDAVEAIVRRRVTEALTEAADVAKARRLATALITPDEHAELSALWPLKAPPPVELIAFIERFAARRAPN